MECDISDINECDQMPCMHHGTCINTPGHFNCTCVDGFEGELCEKGIFHDHIHV